MIRLEIVFVRVCFDKGSEKLGVLSNNGRMNFEQNRAKVKKINRFLYERAVVF